MTKLAPTIENVGPVTALAPMQDVTTLPFMKLIGETGPPDWFFTEYFRVTEHSKLEKHIVDSITKHGTGRPIFAQLIGENSDALKRTIKTIEHLPIAGIDLNMGCPAPKVYKKNVGGGLLRNLDEVRRVVSCMREAISGTFTVKMRVGFADWENLVGLLEIINECDVELLSLHGRTVHGGYRSPVEYPLIRQAVDTVKCPVLANGEISSVAKAVEVQNYVKGAGLMIGRAAIRNPWIFRQIRDHFAGRAVFQPKLRDVREYVDMIRTATFKENHPDRLWNGRMKKFVNFVGTSIEPNGHFLYEMRRARTTADLLKTCDKYMVAEGREHLDYPAEPYPGLIARPNCESNEALSCSSFST